MTRIYNRKHYQVVRRNLRGNMTRAESLLWSRLRKKQVLGQRFLRQYGVGRYILDFYCPKYKLAIEIDGESHLFSDAPEYDCDRQQYIEAFGINFLRFRNSEVDQNLESDNVDRAEIGGAEEGRQGLKQTKSLLHPPFIRRGDRGGLDPGLDLRNSATDASKKIHRFEHR